MPASSPKYDFSAQRLYVDSPLTEGLTYECTTPQVHYILNVLRLRTGNNILIFNGYDGEWLAQVETPKKNRCHLTVLNKQRDQSPGPDIEYIFAPLKRARLDYMVQKVTELGVSALHPVLTRYTIVDRLNLDRMRANVIEAAEQCGILHIPKVSGPQKLAQMLENWAPERRIVFCDEAAPISSPVQALSEIKPGPVAVLIGPEGGFSDEEREKLQDLPFVSAISLGPRIMRADTAAVAALSLVNGVLGDW